MAKISLDDVSPEQYQILNAFINEGKIRGYEEVAAIFEREYMESATEDPYYGYYVKHVLDIINSKLAELLKAVDEA